MLHGLDFAAELVVVAALLIIVGDLLWAQNPLKLFSLCVLNGVWFPSLELSLSPLLAAVEFKVLELAFYS